MSDARRLRHRSAELSMHCVDSHSASIGHSDTDHFDYKRKSQISQDIFKILSIKALHISCVFFIIFDVVLKLAFRARGYIILY